MRLRSPGGQKPSRRWTVGASPQRSLLLSAGLSLGVPAGGGDPLQGVNVDPSVGSLGPSRALEEREGGSWCLSAQLSFSWAPGWAAALSGKALGDPFIFQQSHRPRALHEPDAGFQDCGWLLPHVATRATGLPCPSRESPGPGGAPRRGASGALRPPPPAFWG